MKSNLPPTELSELQQGQPRLVACLESRQFSLPSMFSAPLRCLCLSVACGAFALLPAVSHAADADAPDTAAMQGIANIGEGFVVWERALNGGKGDWRIWTRPLDPGGQEAQLVPTEEGRNHFAPKLSPDGSKLAYVSYKRGQDGYNRKSVGSLWLMDLTTRKQVLLSKEARCYQEDRAVVWFDDSHLCFIDGDAITQEMDLSTGKITKLITEANGKYGFLVNSTKTYATSGDPEFAPFNQDTGVVDNITKLDGCQPYFTQDGKWGFWMGGVGGPVNRFFLPLRWVSPIIEGHDPRLSAQRAYIYFPMISSCMRLFAFGASPDQHDHFTANYNIFVALMDPGTLEVIGKPVRYTFFKGTDRYPDVFAKPLPLGSRYVEGAAHLDFQSPDGKTCTWRVDGTAAGTGNTLTHFFEKEGDHWVEAEEGGKVLKGFVHVRHPVPPAVVSVNRGEDKTLTIAFNKAVSLDHAKVTVGETVLKWKGQKAFDHLAIVELPPTYVPLQEILISGVQDREETPLELAPTRASVNLPPWPAYRDDLSFAWENRHNNPLSAQDTVVPEAKGKVWWSAAGGMDLQGGAYEMPKAGDYMMHDGRRTHAVTLEAIITPRAAAGEKDVLPIFSLETEKGAVRWLLSQKKDGFYLFLATEQKDKDMTGEERLAPVLVGRPQHVVVGYENDTFSVYVNGSPVTVKTKIYGRPSFEKRGGMLRVGESSKFPGVHWLGNVDHVACYHRVFNPAEALALYDYASVNIKARPTPAPVSITARLVEVSRLPKLEEIRPYHEALVKNCYEVLPNKSGGAKPLIPAGTKVVVTHWVWMNGEAAAAPPAAVGKTFPLTLEPLATHPEIKSLVNRDDLTNGLGSDEYLEVSGG